MRFLKREWELWKSSRVHKGPTLQRRLIAFFAMVVVSVILCFTLLLILFGITGSGRQTVERYLQGELNHISHAVEEDLGNLSVTGIHLSEQLTDDGQLLADELGIPLKTLLQQKDPRLLSAQLSALLSVARQNACGGVFLVLDAGGENGKLPGMFIKKTQPVSSASMAAKTYCLRGSAEIARKHEVELLAQWQMDYDSAELPFLQTVLKGARENPGLPLSRLYYWSGRLRLNGNSETGILLCVPLRLEDGTVYGLCGIEVSDRMFKQLYSPDESAYQSVFALAAPMDGTSLRAEQGLIAGNSYLTGSQMTLPLLSSGSEGVFSLLIGQRDTYGGLHSRLALYPTDSPYAGEEWAMAVLMPQSLLKTAIRGSSTALIAIVALLLVSSLVGCVFISRRYLQPIYQGISSIRERAFESQADFGVAEIDDLFADLARDIRARQDEMEQLRARMDRLTDKKQQEIDPEAFALFLTNLKSLTVTERRIFDLYLEGRAPKEILELTQIKENTLKYHNRNIYGKLGVANRKQLLQFTTLMEQHGRERENSGA